MLRTYSRRFVLCFMVVAAITAAGTARVASAAQGDCAQPVSAGETPTASDALFVLRASTGLEGCEPCVCDVDGSGAVGASDALITLRLASGNDDTAACPACGGDPSCPGIAQFTLLAGTRGPCATNTDCGGLGICVPELGRCKTPSELDSGWTGLAHDADVNDVVPARLVLACDGPAPCGECAIVDLDPSLGNCRCADDNRTICAQPFAPSDEQSCGGAACHCYFGPPLPLLSGNAPTCLLNRVDAVGGNADVDAGSGTIDLNLAALVHLGITTLSPCPPCIDDATPGDGTREGTCAGGRNDGQPCDAQSANTTFPAPEGGRHSLDCFPSADTNISGDGLEVDIALTTGRTELAADLPCSELPELESLRCPCRTCSDDGTKACSSDDECAAIGAGSCANPSSPQVLPNACTDGVCQGDERGEGQCAAGPDDLFCDGITRADGSGLIQCSTNADCASETLGADGGECSLSKRRECYPDPIVSQGAASPVAPLGAAAYCAPPTNSQGINSVAGLPGPGRLIYQSVLQLFCAGEPTAQYEPGVGNCPVGGAD
jgi:hypothetical protein